MSHVLTQQAYPDCPFEGCDGMWRKKMESNESEK